MPRPRDRTNKTSAPGPTGPGAVPAFPVVNLALNDDDTVTLDGRPVAIGLDQAPTDAGVQAVAALVRDRQLGAVRVRATSPTGTHLMVVTADAQAHDLGATVPPQTLRAVRGQPRRALALGTLAAMAATLGLAGAGVWAASRYQTAPPEASAAAGPPGQGENVPVLVPPGFATAAAWSHPVSDRAPVLLRPDGSVITTGDNGALRVVDPTTGLITWRGSRAPAPVHLSTVDGRPVLAATTGQTLHLWPLDIGAGDGTDDGTDDASTDDTADGTANGTVAATTIDLMARADVSYLGTVPLVTLDDQTVALLTPQGLTRRDVPVPAAPVLASDRGVIATDADSWWLITPDAEPEQHPLPTPPGAIDAPHVMSAADDTHLIGVWATDDPARDVVALLDLTSNTVTAHTTVPAGRIDSRDEPVRDARGATLTLGSVLVDVTSGDVVDLGEVTPAAVTGRTVHATRDRAAVVVDASDTNNVAVTPYTDPPAQPVLPAAADDDVVYVVADKVDQTLLYALPRHPGGQP